MRVGIFMWFVLVLCSINLHSLVVYVEDKNAQAILYSLIIIGKPKVMASVDSITWKNHNICLLAYYVCHFLLS